jgi:hypothetical protein
MSVKPFCIITKKIGSIDTYLKMSITLSSFSSTSSRVKRKLYCNGKVSRDLWHRVFLSSKFRSASNFHPFPIFYSDEVTDIFGFDVAADITVLPTLSLTHGVIFSYLKGLSSEN